MRTGAAPTVAVSYADGHYTSTAHNLSFPYTHILGKHLKQTLAAWHGKPRRLPGDARRPFKLMRLCLHPQDGRHYRVSHPSQSTSVEIHHGRHSVATSVYRQISLRTVLISSRRRPLKWTSYAIHLGIKQGRCSKEYEWAAPASQRER